MARRLSCAWWRRLTFCRQACFCGVTRCAPAGRRLLEQLEQGWSAAGAAGPCAQRAVPQGFCVCGVA
eukprot:scaffold1167_cov66-Phaeocystis_antarctica.AAC.2